MCHKISLRERGKQAFELQTGEYPSLNDAIAEGTQKITNTGFDSFEIWAKEGTYATETKIIKVPEPAKQAASRDPFPADDRDAPTRLESRNSR